jgi:hypothetical protein
VADEQAILDQYNKNRLVSANQRVRESLAGGMPVSVIADKMSPTDRDQGYQMMAAMSLSETHNMPLGQSLAVAPSVLEDAYGKDYGLENVVNDLYTKSEPFSIPFKPISEDDIKAQIELEEEQIPVFEKERDQFSSNMNTNAVGAFNQSFMINRGVLEEQREFDWFAQDPQKGEFYNGMIEAETEEQRDILRQERFLELFGREQERIESLKLWEDSMTEAKYNPPGIWTSKLNAWRQGTGRVATATLDLAGDLTEFAGKVAGSQSTVEMANEMSDWARAYHKATQLPELSFKSVNEFDRHTNNFLANAPYTGAMITSAVVSPEKVTPFVMFAGGFSMASSSIKQTALDNGISEQSANLRGWIGGGISGLLEGGSGGAAKFLPTKQAIGKRIAGFAGKLTKNALREILLEELPQEAVEAMFSGDVPRNEDGSLDWDQVTNRVIDTAIGAAFMSTAFTSSSSVVGEALAWDAKRGINKDSAQAMQDAMDLMTSEEIAKEPAKAIPKEQVAVEQVEEDVKAQEVKEEAVQDEIEHETEVNDIPVVEQVKNTVQYGVVLQPDGKYTVTDWETQNEIKSNLTKENAVKEANELNASEIEVPVSRARVVLPTSQDIETLTHTQLLNTVFGAVSKNSQIIAKNAADAVINTHKDLAVYAKSTLSSLDISESQRNSMIKKIASAKTEADKVRTITAIEAIKEVSRKRKLTSQFKKIRSMVNRKGKLKIRDGGIHHSTYTVVSDLINNYTTLSDKTLNSVKRAKSHLDGIRAGVEEDFSAEFAEAVMPTGLTSKFSEIMATPLKDLSADQIQELNETLQRYLKQSQLWNKLLVSRQAREQKNFLNNATNDIKLKPDPKALKGEKLKRGLLKSAFDVFGGIKNDDMHTLAVKIWGRFNPLNQLLTQARRSQLELTLKYREYLQKVASDNNITPEQFKEWSAFTHDTGFQEVKEVLGQGPTKFTFEIGGEIRDFTMAEMMSIAMHTRNKYNMGQVVKNGITTTRQKIGKMTSDELSQILDTVQNNPQASAFIDALTLFYINQAADINKISREVDGIDIASVEDYFHIEYEPEGGVIGTEYVRDSLVDEEGRLKARTSSRRPVAVRDIFQIIAEDINVVSNFAGTTEATRKMRSLLNYGPFREKMRNSGGEHVLKELDSRLSAYQRTRQKPLEAIERAVQKLTRGASQAVLVNPAIWALQPTSAALYATEASPKYMKAMLSKASSEMVQDLDKNWILYSARRKGIGASKSVASRSEVKKIFTGQGTVSDKALVGMHKADLIGITQAAKIVMAEMQDEALTGTSLDWWQHYGVNPASLKYGTAEYWQAFNDRADILVTLTQPMFFPESKSAFTGSENPYTRAMFRFRGFVDQLGRIVRRNIDMVRYGEISKAEMSYNIGVVVTLVSVITPLIKYAFNKMYGKEPEADQLFRDMITAPLSMVPLLGYPVKQIADTLIGGEGNITPSFSAMPLMMINRILRHSWETARGINYMFDDEVVQSGPNRGKKKSKVFMKRGLVGAGSDFLMLQGVPTKTIESIGWFKDKK